MLIRITGGNDGIKPYLETAHKDGREFSREQMDQRVMLAGDLEMTDAVIQAIDSAGERYLHITLAFKEDHLAPEVLQQVTAEFEAFAFSAYRPDEYSFYAEAHLPRIKSYIDRSTGERVERKPHIHIVIPNCNLLTGRRLDLFGKTTQQVRFLSAAQEHVNNTFGLASPQANRRVKFTGASGMISRYKGDAFAGRNSELRASLLEAVLSRDITTAHGFRALLAERGEVRERNAGKPTAYFNLKLPGSKGVNLKDHVFSRDFIELPREDKHAALAGEVQRRYEEASAARTDPAAIGEALGEWHEIRAKEVKYLNSGNVKAYRDYRASDRDRQLEILADREARFYAKHDKEPTDGQQHQRSPLERIGDNLRAASHDLESAGRRAQGLDRGARKLADRSAVRAVAAAVRRHRGDQKHLGAGRREQRRPADNMIGQLHHQQHEAARRRGADARADMAKIKRDLDARRLLASLGATHGVVPEKYEVTKGKDGGDRITCGQRHLNVSDFLTAEMKLPWSAADKVLREEYASQRANVPIRNVPAESGKSPLWGEFQEWRKALPGQKAEAWDAQRHAEKERRAAATKIFQASKAGLYADGSLSHSQRRAALSVLRMEKVQGDKVLTAAIEGEREQLKSRYQVKGGELFRVYLQEGANAGDELALAELRRQRTEPERADTREPQLASADKQQRDGRGRDVLEQGGATTYRVERNGDVIYRMANRDVLRDEARSVRVLEPKDREVLETGLRLAMHKFGRRIEVTGTDEFKQQVVQAAVEARLPVEFSDTALQALHQELDEARRAAAQAPAAPRPGQPAPASRDGAREVDRVTDEQRQRAREIDLPAWLAARGDRIEKNGSKEFKLRQGDGEAVRLYRSDKDGVWLVRDGHRTLDAIGFVQEREHVTFQDAVRQLAGEHAPTPKPLPPPVAEAPAAPLQLRLANPAQREAARSYIEGRGISSQTIEQACEQGFMAYDYRGAVFVGRDASGAIRSAETRFLQPQQYRGEPLTKMSYRGSDKTFSPILRGEEGAKEIHMVEGGVSALALRDIHRRERPGEPLPTIIVTGGARTLKWQDNPEIAELLKQAECVSIHKENERDSHGRPDPGKQADTDEAHANQWRAVEAVRGGEAGLQFERPVDEFKDLAERNAYEAKLSERQAEQTREEEEQRSTMRP